MLNREEKKDKGGHGRLACRQVADLEKDTNLLEPGSWGQLSNRGRRTGRLRKRAGTLRESFSSYSQVDETSDNEGGWGLRQARGSETTRSIEEERCLRRRQRQRLHDGSARISTPGPV